MDVEKQIETLRQHGVSCVRAYGRYCSICDEAATALSTLQAENESLKEKLYDGEGVNLVDYWMQQAKIEENGHRNCQAENEKLRAEVESLKKEHCAGCSIPAVKAEQIRDLTDAPKLRAELEQVKAERDAAVSDLETIMAYGGGNLDTCQYCKNGQCYARGGTKLCLPKWRGIKED